MKGMIKDHLSEYIKGRSLERADLSSFPLVFRDLQLNEKKVQEFWDEDHESATELTSGKIGMVKVTPGWLGTVDVHVTNIDLTFSFSATKALANSMKPKEVDNGCDGHGATPAGPPPNCPPRFCCNHDTSDKRIKGDPVSRGCKSCGIQLTSSYKDFQLCPPCSEKEERCMICGVHASSPTSVEPPAPQGPPPMCPPRFCSAHDSSDKRVKCEPTFKECKKCGIKLQTSYRDFSLCPPCSEKDQKCMICGSHAPQSSNYIPAGPDGQGNGQGQQANLPPPPPPPPQSARQPMSQSRPAAEDPSMYMSRPAIPDNLNSTRLPGSPLAPQNDAWSTVLPPQSRGAPPPRPPWQQNHGSMSARPNNQRVSRMNDDADESFAGFLRFVAADIWKTCATDTRQPDSPERPFVRRGGA